MSEISRVKLFGKLNPLGYKAVEGATVFCKLRGNPYVELVHWLHQIIQNQDSDLHHITRHFNLDASRLAADFTSALDRLPRGATSISDISSHIDDAIERGWIYGTLAFGEGAVRTGHLIVGCVKTDTLRNALYSISKEFKKIKDSAEYAMSKGLIVNAGHGLNYTNVKQIANIKGINELNIGHSIISRAVFTGLYKAVKDMKALV